LCYLFNAEILKMLHILIQILHIVFLGQKISNMRRLLALNEELIKELIPQIGLRASFLYSWKCLKLIGVPAVHGEVLFTKKKFST
jgi:hypothetical protein